MRLRRIVVSIGVGGTAFLGASVIGFEVFGGDFPSAFYVLPIALLVAIVASGGTYRALAPNSPRSVRSGLTGLAAFSYSFFHLWFVRYAIAATRTHLPFDLIALLSVVLTAVVAALSWWYRPVLVGD